MKIYTSLKEVIGATTEFVFNTREADIKRTSPEVILNLFIAANRFGREAIAACYRKIYGAEYPVCGRCDYVAQPIYMKAGGWNTSGKQITISWFSFLSSYQNFINIIAHEIAHDKGYRPVHGESFWQEYYRNCQCLGLIASDIPFEEGMIEDIGNVRLHGWGRIKGITRQNPPISFTTLDRRRKALRKHDVFRSGGDPIVNIISRQYMAMAQTICEQYEINYNRLPVEEYHDKTIIDEPWLLNPSEEILDPSV